MDDINKKIIDSEIDEELKCIMVELLKHMPEPYATFVTPITAPELAWYVIPAKSREDLTSFITINFWEDVMYVQRERLHMKHDLYHDIDLYRLSYADPKHTVEFVSNLLKKEIKDEDEFLRGLDEWPWPDKC